MNFSLRVGLGSRRVAGRRPPSPRGFREGGEDGGVSLCPRGVAHLIGLEPTQSSRDDGFGVRPGHVYSQQRRTIRVSRRHCGLVPTSTSPRAGAVAFFFFWAWRPVDECYCCCQCYASTTRTAQPPISPRLTGPDVIFLKTHLSPATCRSIIQRLLIPIGR